MSRRDRRDVLASEDRFRAGVLARTDCVGGLLIAAGFALAACSGAESPASTTPSRPTPDAVSGASPHTDEVEEPAEESSTIWGPERRVWSYHDARRPSGPMSDVRGQCGDAAFRLAELGGITSEVTECEVLEYRSDDRALHVIRFAYGPAQDCESGCFQDHLAGIVYASRAWVARVPSAGVGYAHGDISPALRNVLPELGIADPDRYEWYDVPEGFPCANDQSPVIVTEGDRVQWEYDLGDGPRCLARLPGPGVTPLGVEVVLGGRVVLPIVLSGHERDHSPDYSHVTIDVVRRP